VRTLCLLLSSVVGPLRAREEEGRQSRAQKRWQMSGWVRLREKWHRGRNWRELNCVPAAAAAWSASLPEVRLRNLLLWESNIHSTPTFMSLQLNASCSVLRQKENILAGPMQPALVLFKTLLWAQVSPFWAFYLRLGHSVKNRKVSFGWVAEPLFPCCYCILVAGTPDLLAGQLR
jgi:hypothetical protein